MKKSDRQERKALLEPTGFIEQRVSRNHNMAVIFLMKKGYPLLCEPAILCLGAALEDVINAYLALAAQNLRWQDAELSKKLARLQDAYLEEKWNQVNKLMTGAPADFPRTWELALIVRNEVAHSTAYVGKIQGPLREGLRELDELGLLSPKAPEDPDFRGRFDRWELVAWICTQFDEIVKAFASVLQLPEKQLGEEHIEFAWMRDNMARLLSTDRNPPLQ